MAGSHWISVGTKTVCRYHFTKIPIAGALGVGNGPKCQKSGISGYGSKVFDLSGSGLDLDGTYLYGLLVAFWHTKIAIGGASEHLSNLFFSSFVSWSYFWWWPQLRKSISQKAAMQMDIGWWYFFHKSLLYSYMLYICYIAIWCTWPQKMVRIRKWTESSLPPPSFCSYCSSLQIFPKTFQAKLNTQSVVYIKFTVFHMFGFVCAVFFQKNKMKIFTFCCQSIYWIVGRWPVACPKIRIFKKIAWSS